MPALLTGHNPLQKHPKRFGFHDKSLRLRSESRAIRNKPIEIVHMTRRNAVFWHRNTDFDFTSEQGLPMISVGTNASMAIRQGTIFKAL